MMRRLCCMLTLLLGGCAAGAQSPPATHGYAYVNVNRIETSTALRKQLAAYDREIAALRATQAVPALRDTRGVVRRQEDVVRNGAHEAVATLDAIRQRIRTEAPRDVAAGSDTTAVYRSTLQSQSSTSLSLYRSALQARVQSAYDNRAQQLAEHEAELEISLDRAVADQRLQLRVKLQNLKAPYANRSALLAKLNGIDESVARKIQMLQAQDAGTLAEYRARLQASAANDYAAMERELASNAQANWRVRERVAASRPPVLRPIPVTAKDADFTRAADDIAQRFAAIGTADARARGDAANEIIALEHEREQMIEDFHRTVTGLAVKLALSRGLRLDPTRPAGAVDLTPDVQALVAHLFG